VSEQRSDLPALAGPVVGIVLAIVAMLVLLLA
jgi:hypothetical protein